MNYVSYKSKLMKLMKSDVKYCIYILVKCHTTFNNVLFGWYYLISYIYQIAKVYL